MAEQSRLTEEQKRAEVEREADRTAKIPQYDGLRIVGGVVQIAAYIVLGLAALLLIFAFVSVFQSSRSPGPGSLGPVAFLSPAIGLVICGIVLLALAQSILAFRDIAMNSWKQLTLLQKIERHHHEAASAGEPAAAEV